MSEERLCSGEDHKTLFSGKAYLDDIFSEELNPVIEQTLMFLHDCYIKGYASSLYVYMTMYFNQYSLVFTKYDLILYR